MKNMPIADNKNVSSARTHSLIIPTTAKPSIIDDEKSFRRHQAGTIIFYSVFGIWLLYNILYLSFYRSALYSLVPSIYVRVACLLALAMREVLCMTWDKRTVVAFIPCVFLFLTALHACYLSLIDTIALIFAARNCPIREIVKLAFFETTAIFLFVVVSAGMGVIESITATDGSYSLGFRHKNYFGAFSFFLVCSWAYIRASQCKVLDIAVMTVFACAVFAISKSRAALLASIFVVMVMLIFLLRKGSAHHCASLRYIAFFIPAFSFIIPLLLIFAYNPESAPLSALNSLLSDRLSLAQAALNTNGVAPFGQLVPFGDWNTYNYLTGETLIGDPSYIVDNVTARLLLHCGTVFTVLYLGTYCASCMIATDKHDYLYCSIAAIISIYASIEAIALYALFNPLIFGFSFVICELYERLKTGGE